MTQEFRQHQEATDPDQDHYPDIRSGLSRILEQGHFEEGPVERLEVTFLASGEATYRYWAPRADEPEGGYLDTP